MSASQELTSQTIVAPQVLLGNHLKALKLPTFAREYEKVALELAQDRADYPRYLLRLCELERIDRERRNVERRIRLARFTQIKSLDTFDFAAQPSLNKPLVLELARCEWIEKRQSCIALGPSGTGKTHVALALGLAACQKSFSVAFTSAAALDPPRRGHPRRTRLSALRPNRRPIAVPSGGVIVESDRFAQGGINPGEHGKHDRDGLGGSLSGEPGGQRDAGFSFMQDEHGPRALADDQVAFPMADVARAWISFGRA